MATFFPRTVFNTEASFTPLFRLLDDFDSYSRQCQSESSNNNNVALGSNKGHAANKKQQPQQQLQQLQQTQQQNRLAAAPSFSRWQPKFDVRETANAYELYGEVSGLAKDQVSIEFTEPQTLVVRGRVERVSSTTTNGDGVSTAHPYQASVADEDAAAAEEHPASDDADDAASAASSTAPAPATPGTTATATTKAHGGDSQPRFLLTERSVGEFVRSFSFPSRVDREAVKAGLQDGILSITVPKAKKHETVRISID